MNIHNPAVNKTQRHSTPQPSPINLLSHLRDKKKKEEKKTISSLDACVTYTYQQHRPTRTGSPPVAGQEGGSGWPPPTQRRGLAHRCSALGGASSTHQVAFQAPTRAARTVHAPACTEREEKNLPVIHLITQNPHQTPAARLEYT